MHHISLVEIDYIQDESVKKTTISRFKNVIKKPQNSVIIVQIRQNEYSVEIQTQQAMFRLYNSRPVQLLL